jgi:hypothetical protein
MGNFAAKNRKELKTLVQNNSGSRSVLNLFNIIRYGN